jgi:hypothetical protein
MRRYAKQLQKANEANKPASYSQLEEFKRLPKEEMVLYSIYVLADPTLDGERATAAQRLASTYEEVHKESIRFGINRIQPEMISSMIKLGHGSEADLNANLANLLPTR